MQPFRATAISAAAARQSAYPSVSRLQWVPSVVRFAAPAALLLGATLVVSVVALVVRRRDARLPPEWGPEVERQGRDKNETALHDADAVLLSRPFFRSSWDERQRQQPGALPTVRPRRL